MFQFLHRYLPSRNSHRPSRGGSTITLIEEEKTPFQQRLDRTVRRLRSVWRVNVVMVVAIALFASVQLLLFARNPDTDGSLPVVYVPPELVGHFSGTAILIPSFTVYSFLFWLFMFLSFAILIGGIAWAAWSVREYGEDFLGEAFMIILLCCFGITFFQWFARISRYADPFLGTKNVSEAQAFVNAAHGGEHEKIRALLAEKGLATTPAAELLFTEIALHNGEMLPHARYEQALTTRHLAVKPGSPEDARLDYALEYRLHGKAVSQPAQDFLLRQEAVRKTALKRAVSTFTIMVLAGCGMFFFRRRIRVLDGYRGNDEIMEKAGLHG